VVKSFIEKFCGEVFSCQVFQYPSVIRILFEEYFKGFKIGPYGLFG
jgi:hypothetical protein